MLEIVLVGNSNVGKSHIFNRLTGYNRTTGNWDGVSVDIKRASLNDLEGGKCGSVQLTDIPGIPSLDLSYAEGTDSKIAKDFISNGKFDFIINVLDANCLEKGLHLTLQLQERGFPIVVVVNKCDVLNGTLNTHTLSERLGGIKVIAVDTISKYGVQPLAEYLLGMKLSGDEKNASYGKLSTYSTVNKEHLTSYNKYKERATQIRSLLADVVTPSGKKKHNKDLLDKLFINKYFAFPIFLFFIFCAIFATTSVSDVAQKLFDGIEDSIQFFITSNIGNYYFSAILESFNSSVMVVIGLIPPLFMIYLFLSLMEESGYIARVIVVMDGILHKLQLDGKAFIPLMLGFGCNVTALASLKIVESKLDRIKLALALPFVNCNARLAIYTMLSIFFFPEHKTVVIFSLYILSIFISFLVLYAAKFIYRKSEKEFLIFELPKYGIPSIKMVVRKSAKRVRNFIKGAAGMIITFSFLIMLVTNIIMRDKGYAKNLGLQLNKAFVPIGSAQDSWQVPYIMVSGLVAKEAMIGTINGILDEQKRLKLSESWQGHYALLVFIMLYFPCVSVFAAQRKSYGIKIAIASVVLSLVLAYTVSGLIFALLLML